MEIDNLAVTWAEVARIHVATVSRFYPQEGFVLHFSLSLSTQFCWSYLCDFMSLALCQHHSLPEKEE